jgi:predicted MPP superfamily phosphohydrolase
MDEFHKNENFTLILDPNGHQKIDHLEPYEVVKNVDEDCYEIIMKHEPVKIKDGCEYIDIFTGKQYKREDGKLIEII